MHSARLLGVIMLSLILADGGLLAAGDPTVTITSPKDKALFTTREVNVTGNASGSNATRSETALVAFTTGSDMDNLTMYHESMALERGRPLAYDDFDDDMLDERLWTRSEANGVWLAEQNRVLRMSGYSNGASAWGSAASVTTTKSLTGSFGADIVSWSGAGGYRARLYLSQPPDFVYIGIERDSPYGNSPVALWGGSSSGVPFTMSLGAIATGNHSFRIYDSGPYVTGYIDGVEQTSACMTLSSSQGMLLVAAYASGDLIDVSWDNASWGSFYVPSGNFVSQVLDTLGSDPVLKRVQWNATVPDGTNVTVELRSSDNEDMTNPTGWRKVGKLQTTGLPAVKRYLQYRATLTSEDQTLTPLFDNITFEYYKPVSTVEVSCDGQRTWHLANGTTSWYIVIELPEGSSVLVARATDITGAISLKTLQVAVDTTPPTAEVVINWGAECTDDQEVVLEIRSSDLYGVPVMMISESPVFACASWEPYFTECAWILSKGDGPKTVYAKFRDGNGLESKVANATIILDTSPPNATLTINGGAEFARSNVVELNISTYDTSGVLWMQLGDNSNLSDAQWMGYSENPGWQLAPGNGRRTIYARFKDQFGHVSEVVSDSIELDTTPPEVQLLPSNGTDYTSVPLLQLELCPVENYRVAEMKLCEGPLIETAPWQPFCTTAFINLSTGDGIKTVYARLKDAAGNEGQVHSIVLMLDTTAPKTTMLPLPEFSNNFTFYVSWLGEDQGSGVLWYDVQSRDGEAPWTDWRRQTGETGAAFTGTAGHAYYFRARARDRAGNDEPYPDAPGTSITIRVLVPVVDITSPQASAIVKGILTVTGSARHPQPGKEVRGVEVRLDGGPWQRAEGTESWRITFDTTMMDNAPHTLRVRAFDGDSYSEEDPVIFVVKNPPAMEPAGRNWNPTVAMGLAGIVAALVVVGVGIGLFLSRRKKGALPPDAVNQSVASAPGPAPRPARHAIVVVNKVSASELDDEDGNGPS